MTYFCARWFKLLQWLYVYDIIYKPEETPIMLRAKAAGCKVENGYSMLKYQGYKQFSLFTGVEYE